MQKLGVGLSTLLTVVETLNAQLLASGHLSPEQMREAHEDLNAHLQNLEATLNAEWPPPE